MRLGVGQWARRRTAHVGKVGRGARQRLRFRRADPWPGQHPGPDAGSTHRPRADPPWRGRCRRAFQTARGFEHNAGRLGGWTRSTSSATPLASFGTAHRSPEGRQAGSNWALATSIPTKHGTSLTQTPARPTLHIRAPWHHTTVRALGVQDATTLMLRSGLGPTKAQSVYHVRGNCVMGMLPHHLLKPQGSEASAPLRGASKPLTRQFLYPCLVPLTARLFPMSSLARIDHASTHAGRHRMPPRRQHMIAALHLSGKGERPPHPLSGQSVCWRSAPTHPPTASRHKHSSAPACTGKVASLAPRPCVSAPVASAVALARPPARLAHLALLARQPPTGSPPSSGWRSAAVLQAAPPAQPGLLSHRLAGASGSMRLSPCRSLPALGSASRARAIVARAPKTGTSPCPQLLSLRLAPPGHPPVTHLALARHRARSPPRADGGFPSGALRVQGAFRTATPRAGSPQWASPSIPCGMLRHTAPPHG